MNHNVMMNSSEKCKIDSFFFNSPIGSMIIQSCSKGLHSVSQSDSIDDSNFEDVVSKCSNIQHDMDPIKLEKCFPFTNECLKWLSLYFDDPQCVLSVAMPKICPTLNTEKFQERVWMILAKKVGPGHTVSYKQLAEMANNPGAVRAVGSAMASNPFQICVPCHRVLPSSGKLGNYARGKKNKVKAWLLKHEGIKI